MKKPVQSTAELIRIHRHLVMRLIVIKRVMWSRWWNLRWVLRGWKMFKQTKRAERSFASVIEQRNKIGVRCTLPAKKQRQLGLKPQLT